MVTDESPIWERQADEPAQGHAAFRAYRDMPAHRRNVAEAAKTVGLTERRVRGWADEWNWAGRAEEWDDACHRIDDQERLDAIRAMHASHRQAGRAALAKAVEALDLLDPAEMPAAAVIRLLEIGAKLERSTLTVSVEELQGIDPTTDEEDPWEKIARELGPDVGV